MAPRIVGRAPGRLGSRRLEVDLDLAFEEPLQLVDPAIEGRQPADGLAEDAQGLLRRMGRGQRREVAGDRDRLGVPMGAVGCRVALGGQLLGLAGLLEHRLALGEVAGGGGLGSFRVDRSGPIGGQPGERGVAGLDERRGPADGRLGDPDPAGIALAPVLEVGQGGPEGRLGRRGPPVGGRDRGGEALANRGVARDAGQLGVVRPGQCPGRTPRWAGRSARRAGRRRRLDR